MDKWQGYLQDTADLNQTVSVSGAYLGGHAIGIIAVDLVYPKLPGNVVNATKRSRLRLSSCSTEILRLRR